MWYPPSRLMWGSMIVTIYKIQWNLLDKWTSKEKQTERMLMQCTQQKVAKLSKFFIEPFCLSHLCQTAKNSPTQVLYIHIAISN